MELFPTLRMLWMKWDMRISVLLSLAFQILLIILGNRRKYNHRLWIRIVVWVVYLAANNIATIGLGILLNNLRHVGQNDNNSGSQDATLELTAFWAPFLLLHLGGPDSITAYAMEDNELWLRHCLQLVAQTGVAVYVFFLALTRSRLSILSVLMFLPGLIKYGERTWALRCASNEKLRQSLLKRQSFPRDFHIRSRDVKLKIREGYVLDELIDDDQDDEFQPEVDDLLHNKGALLQAYELLHLTKGLFLDSVLSIQDRKLTQFVFTNLSPKNAFQVIEMELGLMYDLLYTKRPLLCTPFGLALRLIAFLFISSVLVLFNFLIDHKSNYLAEDRYITLVLLVAAIALEIYAALALLSSDTAAAVWLNYKHSRTSSCPTLVSLPLFKCPRWSNKMPQYSLISYTLEKRPLPCQCILKLFGIDQKLEETWHVTYKEVPEDFKKLIFRYFKKKALRRKEESVEYSITARATSDSNFDGDLGKAILFWHIVTEVWYYLTGDRQQSWKLIKQISRYMLYLLVVHPSMVTVGVTEGSFEEIADVVRRIICARPGVESKPNKPEACKVLAESYILDLEGVLGDALHHINTMKNAKQGFTEKWKHIQKNWLQILEYAARKCRGSEHGQQLRRGGELLTHVWLLMAHFGLTDHFPSPEKQHKTYRLVAR